MLGQLSSRYKDQRLRETKEQSASRKHQGFSQPQLQQMQQMDFTYATATEKVRNISEMQKKRELISFWDLFKNII